MQESELRPECDMCEYLEKRCDTLECNIHRLKESVNALVNEMLSLAKGMLEATLLRVDRVVSSAIEIFRG